MKVLNDLSNNELQSSDTRTEASSLQKKLVKFENVFFY